MEDQELTADAIFDADDRVIERVDVPEWNGYVYIMTMTGEDRDSFEQLMVDMRSGERRERFANLRAELLARCICTAKGERIFKLKDAARLGQKSARALERCYSAACRLNALSAEDVEELVGNSEGVPSDASTSDSA